MTHGAMAIDVRTRIVQNPTVSLAEDVAVTKRAI
jgi:hypothetical protein